MRASSIRPKFTDRIPLTLDNGVLYISEKFSTSAHNCCCGCGGKVVLLMKPGKWSIERTGDRVSLSAGRQLESGLPVALLDPEQRGAMVEPVHRVADPGKPRARPACFRRRPS